MLREILGKCNIDFNSVIEWTDNETSYKDFFKSENLWTPYLYEMNKEERFKEFNLYNLTASSPCFFKHDIEEMQKYVKGTTNNNYKFDVYFLNDMFGILGFGNKYFIIPNEFIYDISLYENYDNITVSELKCRINISNPDNATSLIPNSNKLANITIAQQKSNINALKQNIEDKVSKLSDIRNGKHSELEEIQKQIDEKILELENKKKELMQRLEEKKLELDAQKAKLEQELYMLETEIYSIRCFMGEVINFSHNRVGDNDSKNSPITLFQKIRYMDEELGKIEALYDVDGEDIKYFEKLISKNNTLFETFCPNEKCVSLIQISRSGKRFIQYNTIFGDMLEQESKYHASQIGILIRNGENLYIGWTDSDKITLDENLFYSENTPGINIEEDSESDKEKHLHEFVSRYFIFSILQGVLENSNILNIPEKVSISRPSKYVIYSSADSWLKDNRFGTLSDILNKTQGVNKPGDYILTWDSLSDGHYSGNMQYLGYRSFERAHGDSHLTGDVVVKKNTIYKLNLVEKDDYYSKIYYHNENNCHYATKSHSIEDCHFVDGVVVDKIEPLYHTYISLQKNSDVDDYVYRGNRYYTRKRNSFANFELYSDEFINLSYLNSIWIKYVITTRNLGFNSKSEKGDFANILPFLNTALQFLIKREKEEQDKINNYINFSINDIPEWQIMLSEWKIKNSVSNFTDFQAKRFAKYIIKSREV